MLIIKDLSSNYINIYKKNILLQKLLVWDIHSYYERQSNFPLYIEGKNDTAIIEILNEYVDRSNCRRKINPWPELTPYFKVLGICYEGQIFSISVDK